jgi:hypothetical protein
MPVIDVYAPEGTFPADRERELAVSLMLSALRGEGFPDPSSAIRDVVGTLFHHQPIDTVNTANARVVRIHVTAASTKPASTPSSRKLRSWSLRRRAIRHRQSVRGYTSPKPLVSALAGWCAVVNRAHRDSQYSCGRGWNIAGVNGGFIIRLRWGSCKG